MKIRQSTESDHAAISAIHLNAFGLEEGPEIVLLVNDLLDDETAVPLLSLVAESHGSLVGHILFTAAALQGCRDLSVQILAPLAVVPDFQGTGIGGALIRQGLKRLVESGVDMVFVLGHPGYYPRFGFQTAGVHGLTAPYAIPSEHAAAWMVQELKTGMIGSFEGRVCCSEVLSQPQYWRE